MKIGYARISEISGSTFDRPGLLKLKELLREGDTLIVWRLDRMSRSLKHLIEWVNELHSLASMNLSIPLAPLDN